MQRILNGMAACGRCLNHFFDRKRVHQFSILNSSFSIEILKPCAQHLLGIGQGYKGVRVNLIDDALELSDLVSVDNAVNHILALPRIRAVGVKNRGALVKVCADALTDFRTLV